MSDSLQPHELYSPWNSAGQNTGVGSLSLLQGIFPTQGSNPGLPHCRWILYQLSHKGSPRILEWVVISFSTHYGYYEQIEHKNFWNGYWLKKNMHRGAFQVVLEVKNPPDNAGDMRDVGISPGEGNGNPFQYSWLENFMDRGAWWAIVHEVVKSQTWLKDFHFHFLVFLPGKFHGQRSLAGYSSWGNKRVRCNFTRMRCIASIIRTLCGYIIRHTASILTILNFSIEIFIISGYRVKMNRTKISSGSIIPHQIIISQ